MLATIIAVVASSAALGAIARGVSAWLRGRKQASITIERNSKTGSINAAVTNIDPEATRRIFEILEGLEGVHVEQGVNRADKSYYAGLVNRRRNIDANLLAERFAP